MGIAISDEVRSVIDAYMQDKIPASIGYETHGIYAFADMCHKWFDQYNFPIYIQLKSERFQNHKKKECEYRKALEEKEQHYFDNIGAHRFVRTASFGQPHKFKGYAFLLERLCMLHFTEHTEEYAMKYVLDEYGSLEQAINSTESFIELWNGYAKWFDNRRKRFMEKMEIDIQKCKEMSIKKTPQSHGGVANLLKVLTQTMQKQGADIQNIAKVQYAICIQAGIYIPDEFIRDVAVTLDMNETK